MRSASSKHCQSARVQASPHRNAPREPHRHPSRRLLLRCRSIYRHWRTGRRGLLPLRIVPPLVRNAGDRVHSMAISIMNRILRSVAGLQLLALEFSQTSSARERGSTLWVAFVPGATYPWRLVETERSRTRRLRRKQMLCFALLAEILRAIEERLAWATADEQFRARHMATPGGFPGVTGDWVPSKDFDLVFASTRHLIREQMCATRSAQTVVLR
jgi:hypothetical protein